VSYDLCNLMHYARPFLLRSTVRRGYPTQGIGFRIRRASRPRRLARFSWHGTNHETHRHPRRREPGRCSEARRYAKSEGDRRRKNRDERLPEMPDNQLPPTFNREIKDYYYKCFCSRKISRGRLISGPHTAFEGYIHIRRWESRFHGWEED
jgi:hypothetical protein